MVEKLSNQVPTWQLNGRDQVVHFLQLLTVGNEQSVVDHWEKEDYGLRKIRVCQCV